MDERVTSAELQLDRVSKCYGSTLALADLSLSIQRPQFVTLLGPSGCGKTTTLRLIAGLEFCDSGQIFMRGERIDRLAPYQRNVSTVFQDYALFPHLDVLGNVSFGFKVRKARPADYLPKVRRALERMHIADLAHRRPHQLSGGQQQRVALARTLVLNPSILLFDEPLGALDQNLREEMQIELKRVQREVGITFIYVTHDQAEAFSMSDRVVVLSKGRVEQDGSPAELYNQPRSIFVAQFTGLRHLLKARVQGVQGHEVDVILESGARLQARAGEGVLYEPGESVWIGVRPESVALGNGHGEGSAVEFTVRSIVYGGKTRAFVGRLRTGEEFAAESPASANLPASVAEGQTVMARWAPRDTLIFKAGTP